MAAVPPLAQILRYGDVRGSDTSAVAGVLRGVVLRSAVGLPGAAVGADEETGAKLAELVDGVNSALALLEDEALTRAWRGALRSVAESDRLPGTLAGRATRLLHDAGELDTRAVASAMSRALSPGEAPERGASWIEGFIGTSGLVLVHDPDLLADPRRLDRGRRPGRVHQRPAAAAAGVLGAAGRRATAAGRAAPAGREGAGGGRAAGSGARATGAGDASRGCWRE